MRREKAFEKAYQEPFSKTEDYARLLAIWTWELACSYDFGEVYTDIFTKKNIKVYEIKTVDLEDMLSYMEDALSAGSIFCSSLHSSM